MLINLIKEKIAFFWLLIIMGFLVGFYSFNNIPKENNPAMNLPIFVINTAFPGGNPENIENKITNKLEEELKTISGIKKLESVSNFNFSTIIITFNDNKNIVDAKLEITEKINKTNLPEGASKPTFKQSSPDDSAIYSFSIVGNLFSKNIYEKTKDLENKLKSIEGISDVIVIGKPEKSINIYIDEKKLNEFGLDIKNIRNILANSFFNKSIGKKDIGGSLYSYEIETFDKNLDSFLAQLKETDLVNFNSQSIKLRDVAEIFFEEKSKIEKSFILKDKESINSISFDIKVSPGTDVESVIKNILKEIEVFKKQNPDLQFFETFSRLVEINDVFETFYSNFRQSGLIIMVILFLFIGFRISLGVTIAFPLVYMITFIFLSFMGYTFNNVVSFALILTLGIMVDNLIVITEGIVNEFKEKKEIGFWEALKNTFEKYNSSIIAGTLTTIVMFAPLLFLLSGTIGQFIKPMSITIIITLIVSIFVAILLLPIILKKILPKKFENKNPYFGRKLENISENLGNFSKIFLKNKFTSFLVVVSFWGIFILSLVAVGIGIIKIDFMPPTDRNNIWINMKFPSGFSSEKTQEETNKILVDVKNFFDKKYNSYVEYFYINIGNIYSTSAIAGASNITSENQSYINIKFVDSEKREKKSYQVSEDLQNFINNSIKPKYPSIKDIFTVSGISLGGGKEVGFQITGENLKEISSYIEKIKPEVEKINGVYNLTSSLEFTNGKIKYFIDTNKALKSGLSLESLSLFLTSIKNSEFKPNGIPLKNFTDFGKDDILMNLFTKYEGNIEDLKIGENFVSLSTKQKSLDSELKNISHLNTKLQISIEADKKSNVALGAIKSEIDKIIEKNPTPEGLKFQYNSNISDQEKSRKDLSNALLIGITFMLLILVFQFNSLSVALIVLTSTLLSIIGVIIFLAIFKLPLSFPAQLGLFGVIGVGVNNAILFTDLFNSKQKINLKKDLSDTIKSRFPAIFLTTFTTIAGLITLALKDELWGSLAIAFIGGLFLNILIVLIYLPCFYFLISKKN